MKYPYVLPDSMYTTQDYYGYDVDGNCTVHNSHLGRKVTDDGLSPGGVRCVAGREMPVPWRIK